MFKIVGFIAIIAVTVGWMAVSLKRMRPIIKGWQIAVAIVLAILNAFIIIWWGPVAPIGVCLFILMPIGLCSMAFYGYLWHMNGGWKEMFAFAIVMAEAAFAAIVPLSCVGLFVLALLLLVVGQAFLPFDLCLVSYEQSRIKTFLTTMIVLVVAVALAAIVLSTGQLVAYVVAIYK